MDSTDFRNTTPPDLEISFRGQPVKLWVLQPSQVSTDRVVTAQYWAMGYKELGVIGDSLSDTMRQIVSRVQEMPNTKDNFQTAKELYYNMHLIFEDLRVTRDRAYNYIKMGSLFCVTQDEQIVHPTDGAYTDFITAKKMDMAELQEVYSFFLSVGLEFMKHFCNMPSEVSPKILIKNQKLAMRLIEPKIRKMRTLGISISRDF